MNKLEINIYRRLPIINFPGYYIDTNGEIFSCMHGKNFYPLKFKITKGYKIVRLMKESKYYYKLVSRLVLETFVSECPIGHEACHGINGKLDNHLYNLSWGTKSKNQQDRVRDNTDGNGEKNGNVKLTEVQILEIRKSYIPNSGETLARKFGVSRTQIHNIIKGKSWKN